MLSRRVKIGIATALSAFLVLQIAWRLRSNRQSLQSTISKSVSTAVPIPLELPLQSSDAEQIDAPANRAAVDTHPLDPVLDLARQAQVEMQTRVKDYSGKLIKRERIQGKLGSEVQMLFKIRNQSLDADKVRPLSVYLKFLEPASARGREVIWIEGQRGSKLVGHEGGFMNLLRVELEPTGMLAMMDNKYPITEIGLIRLIEKLIEKGKRDRAIGPCEVTIHENQSVGDRPCRLVQVTHPQPDPRFDFHIAQIFIDCERLVPLRYAAFMWPEKTGAKPPLEEEYTYLDLKINTGLTDDDFDPDNSAYNYP